MKNAHLALITLLFMFVGTTMDAQVENNSNNITIITAPGAYDDGFNIGIQYEHQWNWPYVGAEVVSFPDLNDISYHHIIARFGINQEYGNPVGTRYKWNLGFRGGHVIRSGYSGPYVLLGAEIGAQITLPNGIFGKLIYTPDSKTDSAIWGEDNHTVHSVWAGVGVRF